MCTVSLYFHKRRPMLLNIQVHMLTILILISECIHHIAGSPSSFVDEYKSSCFKIDWYKNSIQPLCTLVHTNLGPTPRNHPATPSVLYISLSPVTTDEVSKLIHPGRGVCVEGEEVEIDLTCCLRDDVAPGIAVVDIDAATGFDDTKSAGLICVCILVLTTSSGHVITPANPPALAPVKSSKGRPISLHFFHCLAHVCACS